jgi:hypothetical protein
MGKLKPGNRTAITRFQLKPPLFLDDALGATEAHAAASHFSTVCATRITVWNFESMSMRPFYVARAEAWWKQLAGPRFSFSHSVAAISFASVRTAGSGKHMFPVQFWI